MTNITIKQMQNEMILRLDAELQAMRSTFNAIDALDRLTQYDLHDQMCTADKLLEQMDELLTRMNDVVGQ